MAQPLSWAWWARCSSMCWWRAWRLSTGSRRRSSRRLNARWVRRTARPTSSFSREIPHLIAEDVDGDPVFLARSQFDLEWVRERNDKVRFVDIKETQAQGRVSGPLTMRQARSSVIAGRCGQPLERPSGGR